MSYAIGNVICGCDIPEGVSDWIHEIGMEPESIGFKSLYNGNADRNPAYCGILLCEISECDNVLISELPLVPTDAQVERAKQLLRTAREKLLEAFAEDEKILDGEEGLLSQSDKEELLASIPDNPLVMLVWSSS